jgi:hypothetical protein
MIIKQGILGLWTITISIIFAIMTLLDHLAKWIEERRSKKI